MGGSRGAGGAGVQRKQQLFPKGSLVEIGSDEEGFKGAWYVATILDTPSSSYRSSSPSSKKKNDLFFVEYQSLLDDDGSTPLREHVKPDFVRPLPPPPSESDLVPSFELYDVVDASYRDGWWTGVITLVLNNSRFIVTFQNPPDEIEFGVSELRVHREWVDGKWVLPEKQRTTGLMFSAGKRVEVSFDKEDYRDFWFPATVLEDLGNDSFVVEYWSLGNGSEAELQKATVDLLHIRPSPPDLKGRNFVLLEKVDAFYNSGWKSGVITKELADRRYIVYFKHTNKDMELNQSDLRPHMEWIDGKWIAASQDVLIPSNYEEHVGGNACIGLNNTQMAVQLASSGVTKDKSQEKTPSINSRENQTEQSTPCDGSPSSRGMASLRKKTKQKNPDIEVSHSRPSKKLKEGNAPETPSLTPYQLNTMLVQATCEENLPSFSSPSTAGAGTNCSKQSMDGDQVFTKPRSRSRGKKILMQQDKPQKVVELDHCASEAVKEKGRPQKLQVKSPQPSTGGKKGKAGVDTAKEFDVKECITKEVDIPVIIGLPCNGMRSPQSENHHQFASGECLKSITDQKEQLNDPAREQIEEINQVKSGEDIPKKKRGRPPKLPRESPNASLTDKKQNGDVVAADEMIVKDCITEVELPTITEAESKKLPNSPTRRQNISSSMMKTPPVKKDKMPNEKVMQASSELLEKPSSKRGRRRNTIVNIESLIQDSQEASRVKSNEGIQTDSRMKEAGMAIDQVPSNVSDDQPLSTWLGGVSPSRTVQQCTVTSERKMEIAVRAATVDGNGNILSAPNQNLPFVKTFPLWETIESMDVFQSMPQNPHFRPLESCKESAREGLAIGCMVTFSSVVKKTTELQFDGPRSSIEDCLETLLDLEGHGFDVKMVRDRLTGLLLIKDKQEFLQDQSKELESRIMEHSHEKSKIDEEIDEINKQIKELKEKRALAMSTMKIKDSEIVSLQSTMNDINEGIETIRLDFEELAADYW